MATFSWNDFLAGAGDGGGIVPPGWYTAKVLNARTYQSQNGNQTIPTTFQITYGPHAGHTPGPLWLTFGPDISTIAVKMTRDRLQVLKVDVQAAAASNQSLDQIAAQLIGRAAEVEIVNEEYPKASGIMRDKVRNIRRLPPSATTPQPPAMPDVPF